MERSGTPRFLALADRIRTLIHERGLRSRDRLPSERQLARDWGVSHLAINRAAHWLVAQGVLRRQGYRLFPVHEPVLPRLPVVRALVYDRGLGGIAQQVGHRWGAQVETIETRSPIDLMRELARAAEDPPAGLLACLFAPESLAQSVLQELWWRNIPVVATAEAVAGVPSVAFDRARGLDLALATVAANGSRAPAWVIHEPHTADALTIGSRSSPATREVLTRLGGRIVFLPPQGRAAAAERFSAFLAAHPETDGYVTTDNRLTGILSTLLRQAGRPAPISVILSEVGEQAGRARTVDRFTVVRMPDQFAVRIAAGLLFDLVWRRQLGQPLPGDTPEVRVEPVVEKPAAERLGTRPHPRAEPRLQSRWPADRAARRAAALAFNAEAFPAASVPQEVCDLSSFANAPLRTAEAFGGEPLRGFPPGLRVLRGVQFHIPADPPGGAAVVQWASRHRRRSLGAALPSRLRIPIDRRIRALWLLLGCGYAHTSAEFGRLRIAAPATVDLPIHAYAWGPPAPEHEPEWRLRSLVQDWWPAFHTFSSDRVRPWLVTERGDPAAYERYLYIVQWLPPGPPVRVRHIEIETSPGRDPALALLALTLSPV